MAGTTFSFPWEVSLMAAIQSVLGKAGIALASVFTLFGEQLVLVGILGTLYFVGNKEWAKKAAVNLLAILLWSPMIKNVVWRRRPYFDHADIQCLKPVEAGADIYDIEAQGYSFPSAHSASAAAAYFSLARIIKRNWVTLCAVAVTLLVGISRFCLGVHYPTDVMAGWVLGLIAAFLVPLLGRLVKRDSLLYGLLLLSGLPGCFYCTTSDFFSGYGLFIGLTAGFLFEKRYVNFERPQRIGFAILRLLVACGLFVGLTQGLKLVLPADFAGRVIRYAVGGFVTIGVYPMAFRPFEARQLQKSK